MVVAAVVGIAISVLVGRRGSIHGRLFPIKTLSELYEWFLNKLDRSGSCFKINLTVFIEIFRADIQKSS